MRHFGFIRGMISSTVATAGKLLRLTCSGRQDETIEDREAFQQYGLQSRPPQGTEVILLRDGHVIVMVASDGREYRLALQDKEVVLYNADGAMVRLQGTTAIVTADTLRVEADAIELGGNAGLKALIHEDVIAVLNSHIHISTTPGNPTSPMLNGSQQPNPVIAAMHATSVTKAK